MAVNRASRTDGAALDSAAIEALRARMRGGVVGPSDADYERARRIWNGTIDRRPAVIARCAGAADVMAAVDFARERGLPLSARGGGHNVSGSAVCDGGVMIDLSPMRGVRVDAARSTVRVGGGATLRDVDHEAQAFGLAVPVGVVTRTGIGGLSLHGGMGFLTRKYGLTCDHLVSADVVTADGRLVVADEKSHPDLLWALRGGGGSFGVVTSFEFRARPVGPGVWMGIVMYPIAEARRVMTSFREIMAAAPDELMALAVYWSTPHDESIPEGQRGVPTLAIVACWSGPMERGEAAIRPIRELGTPIADFSGAMPYLGAQQVFDPEYPDGRRYYWKSIYLRGLDDDVISLLERYAASRPSPITSIDIWFLGGAMARIGPADTAFFRRGERFLLGIEANWNDPAADAVNIEWARRLYDEARRFSPGGAYLNFPGHLEEGEKLLEQTFGANYARLRKVKATYDPDDLFQYNLRIPVGA